MEKMVRQLTTGFIALLVVWGISGELVTVDIMDSGGPLSPQQAAYDVHYYRLALQVFPEDSTIAGMVVVRATMVHPFDWLVLNLDTVFTVSAVRIATPEGNWRSAPFQNKAGELWVYLGRTHQPGESVSVQIAYSGKPRVAQRPPWSGGFTWATTASGQPWIATSCQGEGADIWWPVKDHVSDEPDSMDIVVRVPGNLTVASNGRLRARTSHQDGTVTYHWHVSTPINTYNVALNIAPYVRLDSTYVSVSGDTVPVALWLLPEALPQGRALLDEIIRQVQFFERLLGPYPFRVDKLGVVQTPFLGMEHQTIIAYGANFDRTVLTEKDWGFDALLQHEMSHEWWGNLVTNFDWRDMWLHEGFGTYMQALYVEQLHGHQGYREYMAQLRRFRNELPVAPRTTQSADQIYRAPIYYKGAWVLHTLRFVMGDSLFFRALRRMAYPTPQWERWKDGRQCRFATTDDFLQLVNRLSGQHLEWFFEAYLRQPGIPLLQVAWQGEQLILQWQALGEGAFPMPLELVMNGKIRKLAFRDNRARLTVAVGDTLAIDPNHRVLFEFAGLQQARQWIAQKEWDRARAALKPLLRIVNTRPPATVLLKHIRFRQEVLPTLPTNWFQELAGRYRVNEQTTVTVFKLKDDFVVQTNRRTFEQVLPVSANEFWEVNGRYRYRFHIEKGKVAFVEKYLPDGARVYRAYPALKPE